MNAIRPAYILIVGFCILTACSEASVFDDPGGYCNNYLDISGLQFSSSEEAERTTMTGTIVNKTDVMLNDVALRMGCSNFAKSINYAADLPIDFVVGSLGPSESKAVNMASAVYCRDGGTPRIIGSACTWEENSDEVPNTSDENEPLAALELPDGGSLVATCEKEMPFNCMPEDPNCRETYDETLIIDLTTNRFSYSLNTTTYDPNNYHPDIIIESYFEVSGTGELLNDGWLLGLMTANADIWGVSNAAGFRSWEQSLLGKIDYENGELKLRVCRYDWAQHPSTVTESMIDQFNQYCNHVCPLDQMPQDSN